MSMRLPACGRMALRGWRTCGEGKKERKKKERERRDGDAGVQAEESVGGEELYSEGAVERKEGGKRKEGRKEPEGRKE